MVQPTQGAQLVRREAEERVAGVGRRARGRDLEADPHLLLGGDVFAEPVLPGVARVHGSATERPGAENAFTPLDLGDSAHGRRDSGLLKCVDGVALGLFEDQLGDAGEVGLVLRLVRPVEALLRQVGEGAGEPLVVQEDGGLDERDDLTRVELLA